MGTTHISGDVQEATKILSDLGLEYKVGPISTSLQGEWHEVVSAIEKCHRSATSQHERVVTTITIDDHGNSQHSLRGAVKAVENAGKTAPVQTDTTEPAHETRRSYRERAPSRRRPDVRNNARCCVT